MHDPVPLLPLSVPAHWPVYTIDLNALPDQLRLAREAVDELRASHPDSTPSNVQARYMSPWKSHQINNKLGPLCQSALALARYCSLQLCGRPIQELNIDFMVTDCWAAVYEPGDFTRRHHHFPADFGVVCYLEMGDEAAPLVLGHQHAHHPKAGEMILFPGLMDHEVPATGGRRVCVAMNLTKFATLPTE